MKIHFIAVGGAVMHNLAIALHRKGYSVTGSDDEIFEPSRSRLAGYGLLPDTHGWHPGKITPDIDTVILGMHAREDNPELRRAQELGITIMSFPEYLYEQTKGKKRVVVAGSHGKTTTTAMIMHVFRYLGIQFDYMVGSMITGFNTMVGLSDEANLAVFEGDEYLTSALDRRPKFLHYHADIAILNGIAWDHMNVFPTPETYTEQFRLFTESITEGGSLIYFEDDDEVRQIALSVRDNINKIPYRVHDYSVDEKGFHAVAGNVTWPLKIFGKHNMQNLSAAKEACLACGITGNDFYSAVTRFEGTSKRLQKIKEDEKSIVYLDFAHSPSKVKATVDAVAAMHPGREIIACLELHTYSSLNNGFLPLYRGTLGKATAAYIYFNPHAVELKKLKPLSVDSVSSTIGGDNINVYDDSEKMFSFIRSANHQNAVYLFMSSGDFNGFDISSFP